MARKYIPPDEKIGLKLTAAERKTILKDVRCLDDDYEQALRETFVDEAVAFTLTDWDYLGGEIVYEAEETKDRKRQNRLNGLFAKIEELLATYTNEEGDGPL
jgi:hypothetical protein